MRHLMGVVVLLAAPALACGSTTVAAGSVDAGQPAVIASPPLVCSPVGPGGREGKACSCAPMDGGVVDASPGLCDLSVAPDASCCASSQSYPFAGTCLCAVSACADGGGPVDSCSSPPTEIPAGTCDPSTCSGMACGGGMCCVSSCQAGMCVPSCS